MSLEPYQPRLPFDGSWNRMDFIFLAEVMEALLGGSWNTLATTGMAISPGKMYALPSHQTDNNAAVIYDFDCGFNLVAILGTDSVTQLLGEILASLLVSYDNVAGLVSAFFALDLSFILNGVMAAIDPTKPTVCCGHSLGGATAELLASYLANTLKLPVTAVYTIGSPCPGNAAFAAQITFPVLRLVNSFDIVPAVPQGLGSVPYVPVLSLYNEQWGAYTQVGAPMTQHADGVWTLGQVVPTPLEILAVVSVDGFTPHYAATYLQRAQIGMNRPGNLVPWASGYEKPWILFGQQQVPPIPGEVSTTPIPVPSNFTNVMEAFSITGDKGVLPYATYHDNPPWSFTPSLQAAPVVNSKNCC